MGGVFDNSNTNMKIEKNVPIPETSKYSFDGVNEMEIGDSFLVSSLKELSSARQYCIKIGFKTTSRKEKGSNKIRVWRIL